jgi:7-cyano-7-deazaguanine synthase in queuosine biosynthesis
MQAVLFSGGRDSTLVAVRLIESGEAVWLLSFNTGLAFGPQLSPLRLQELRARYGTEVVVHARLDIQGLVRRFALLDIEEDILVDRHNLALLGEMVAIVSESIVYCARRSGQAIWAGFTGYQKHFPEQRRIVAGFFDALASSYGIRFKAPLLSVNSELEVKEELWIRGLSPKSLETSSMFAESGSEPSDEAVAHYLARKESIAREYIARQLAK